ALGVSAIALTFLLTWQFSNSPNLERSSQAQRANAEVQKVIQQSKQVKLVESNVRFTRADISGQNTLLSEVYVQREPNTEKSAEAIKTELTQSIQSRLLEKGFNATPLVSVNVLEAPKTSH
ncbi:MAG TPA: TIGR00341 family protein, partial [Leptolyngbyaceae cyanobacterium]